MTAAASSRSRTSSRAAWRAAPETGPWPSEAARPSLYQYRKPRSSVGAEARPASAAAAASAESRYRDSPVCQWPGAAARPRSRPSTRRPLPFAGIRIGGYREPAVSLGERVADTRDQSVHAGAPTRWASGQTDRQCPCVASASARGSKTLPSVAAAESCWSAKALNRRPTRASNTGGNSRKPAMITGFSSPA
jgi:hypothetical protein